MTQAHRQIPVGVKTRVSGALLGLAQAVVAHGFLILEVLAAHDCESYHGSCDYYNHGTALQFLLLEFLVVGILYLAACVRGAPWSRWFFAIWLLTVMVAIPYIYVE